MYGEEGALGWEQRVLVSLRLRQQGPSVAMRARRGGDHTCLVLEPRIARVLRACALAVAPCCRQIAACHLDPCERGPRVDVAAHPQLAARQAVRASEIAATAGEEDGQAPRVGAFADGDETRFSGIGIAGASRGSKRIRERPQHVG